jgi:predicted CXXCH cytochrome family protein
MRTLVRALALSAVLVASVFAVGGGARVVLGEHKDVADTQHNVASPGTPPCVYCHVPRDAAGQLLWPGGQPDADGPLSGEKRMCFSCHDGTVTSDRSYVFNPNRPEHVRVPGAEGQDCDRCHDPHGTDNPKFLRLPGDANLCWNCHFRAGPMDHPIGVDAPALGIHPADTSFSPKDSDYNGTRLWNQAGTGPGNLVMCLTCHSPHGGQPGTEMITVIPSSGQGFYQTLCSSCHVNH